jgi:GH15 family glucan-1,4-alpha-glucosidase
MDAAGHLAEADKYWRWEASVQNTTSPPNSGLSPGTWFTNYSFWGANTPIPFVQPELDSTGLFNVGVYKHFQALDATDHAAAVAFVNDPVIKAAVERGSNFIVSGIDPTLGFGPQDQSIWEERYEFATFTQATYTAGLLAAARLAPVMGDASMASSWMTGSTTIRAAILRPTNTPGKPGMWFTPTASGNPPIGCIVTPTFHGPNCNGPYPSTGDPHPYFARGIFSSGGETPNNNPPISVDSEVDSSTGILWVLGVIPANSTYAVDQRNKINRWLGKGTYGISRHENDDFYFSSVYSPGGQYEAHAADPIWPQPVMYMSMLNTWQGQYGTGRARLSWYASVTPYGYEPPGEAVDWTNMQPLISTASEPVTGAWFMLATLTAQHQFDTRLTGYGS